MYTQILPHAARLSEFIGTGLNGDCVETAMAVAMGIVKGADATPQAILDIVHSMQGQGIASSNGATSINNAHDWLIAQKYAIAVYIPYGEPFQGDWLNLLRTWAGSAPIVLNVANAQALTDVETQAHDEVGVHYHGIAIIGRQDDGYLAVDGDNPQATQRFQVYPRATIEAAQPCGMIVLAMPAPPTPPSGGPTTLPAPFTDAGWSDDGTTLKGPPGSIDNQSHTVQGVLRDYALSLIADSTMTPADTFLQDMQHDGSRYTVMTSYHLLIDPGDGNKPFCGNIGANVLLLEQQVAQDAAMIADLHDQLNGANQVTQQLQAEIAQLQQQPPGADPTEHALAQAVLDLVNEKMIQHAQNNAGGN